jgi:hypothetical protein
VNDRIIEERYRLAREQYAELGVDTGAALAFRFTAGRETTSAGSKQDPTAR